MQHPDTCICICESGRREVEKVEDASAPSAKTTSSPPTGGRGHEYVGVAGR